MSEFSIGNNMDIKFDTIRFDGEINTDNSTSALPMAKVSGANVDEITLGQSTPTVQSFGDDIANDLAQYITHPNPATSQRMGVYSDLLDSGYSPLEAFAFREGVTGYFAA